MVKEGIIGINRICQLAGISKATFYSHQDPREKFADKYAHLKKKVEKIIRENSAYGIKRIKQAIFDKYQIIVGRDSLGKLLIVWGFPLKERLEKTKEALFRKY